MGYEYISFSDAVKEHVGHDFTFLDSEQFPADVKIRRVDYDPAPHCGLRVVIESASYAKTMEEALSGPGLIITCYSRSAKTEEGRTILFFDYNPIPEDFWPKEIVKFGELEYPKALYAKLVTRRRQYDNSNARPADAH